MRVRAGVSAPAAFVALEVEAVRARVRQLQRAIARVKRMTALVGVQCEGRAVRTDSQRARSHSRLPESRRTLACASTAKDTSARERRTQGATLTLAVSPSWQKLHSFLACAARK